MIKLNIAQPIWPKGRSTEKNLLIGFGADIMKEDSAPTILHITASSIYRIYLNGNYIGFGPARSAHDYYRIDEYNLTDKLNNSHNRLAIEVVGYNVNSYYTLDQESFLLAEVTCGNKILNATGLKGNEGFEALELPYKIQKVQRYSFQRPFVEAYQYNSNDVLWRTGQFFPNRILSCEILEEKNLLERGVSYPALENTYPRYIIQKEHIRIKEVTNLWKDRSLLHIGETLKGYTEDELSLHLSDDIQKIETIETDSIYTKYPMDQGLNLLENTAVMYAFENNITGFIGLKIKCSNKTKLYIVFDEVLSQGDIDFKRLECVNVIQYGLEEGEYQLETIEPYTMKYMKIIVVEGDCFIESVYIRELKNPDTNLAFFHCNNDAINQIYQAGLHTFMQNAVDIYMDCPSRERAGWLCDSYFTSRVEYDLTGNSKIENNFIENYLLPETFDYLPKGMLPMCYPADHYDSVFIPNWSLWFVLELYEFYQRTNDKQMVERSKVRVYQLFEYFQKYENEYGLLEQLDGWIFVEWSKCNDFIQDVNYPTNMLYSYALKVAGKLYQDNGLIEKSENIKKVILEQGFNGNFFIDNAIRLNGRLELTNNITETTQYYAFYFDIATIEKNYELWNILLQNFGPLNKVGTYSYIHPSNAFIGNYLRLELLSKFYERDRVIKEIEGYFLGMAVKVGTLWEHNEPYASCNHGFASHVIRCIHRDAVGISRIDKIGKVIEMHPVNQLFTSLDLILPIDGEQLKIHISSDEKGVHREVIVPKGYELLVKNISI
ncbi:alpha-L-rhamnosidase-related protein [Lachnoclostridium sp.]|uniref:alpha-L-rhamnosidase-related protein n=1 Tax=Lachnoclostridium sp. TaxID=2028282 RepID=UPI00289D744D|nr:hypothetical protein [Lachnoclostridium sp.]